MPLKKINFEKEKGIHNPPDKFFYKYGKITLISDNLFTTPLVVVNHIQSIQTFKTIKKWKEKHGLPPYRKEALVKYEDLWLKILEEQSEKTRKQLIKEQKELITDDPEIDKIINNFVDYLSLSEKMRKNLFSGYRETQLVKLKNAIEGLNKAKDFIWNEEVKLPDIYFKIVSDLKVYIAVRDNLKKRKTGYHQLLYELLIPLVNKLKEYGFSVYKIKPMLKNLLDMFNYKYPDVPRELIKYIKSEFYSDNLIKKIQSINIK